MENQTLLQPLMSMQELMEQQIKQFTSENRYGTAMNYRRALRRLNHYTENHRLPLGALTPEWAAAYEASLIGQGLTRNSVSFYLRTLRAAFNKAVRSGLVPPSDPFRTVYTGVERTRKRAASTDTFRKLLNADLSRRRGLAFVRDLYLFSFCTRGMSFVDLAFLRRADVREGCIYYTRRKTGRPLAIRVEPLAARLMERYYEKASPYVFPILRSSEPKEAYRQYCVALNYYNRRLRRLSELLHLSKPLTFHTARHGWATAARKAGAPVSEISEALGHTSERTTRIYLASFEASAIDRLNRSILASLKKVPGAL